MSVRLWLMVADCWRCQTSIELTEEQEREALRLLQKRDAARRQGPAAAPAASRPGASFSPRPATAQTPACRRTDRQSVLRTAESAVAPG